MKKTLLLKTIFAVLAVLVIHQVTFAVNQLTIGEQKPNITIDPQSYQGKFWLVNNDTKEEVGIFPNEESGEKPNLYLAPGNYTLDNNNRVAGSYFTFSINQSNQITNLSNSEAAEVDGRILRLKNTSIKIVPGNYTGRYKFLEKLLVGPSSGDYIVIPGLRYGIDNGTAIGNSLGRSYFYFDVKGNGDISNTDIPEAAYGEGKSLKFKNATLKIDPQNYPGGYNISSYFRIRNYVSGNQPFVLIPGLLYAFDSGSSLFQAYFNLNAKGKPINISPLDFACGSSTQTLTLRNVSININPEFKYEGDYYVNGVKLNGKRTLILIPEILTRITVRNISTFFIPSGEKVTSSPTIIADGTSQNWFDFSPCKKE